MRKLKIAVVGAGTWGENHARIYMAHNQAELVALCDTDSQKVEQLAEKLGIRTYFSSVDQMLAGCDCDAVAIVTPDFAHADVAVAAARAKKHLLIEKPIATTNEEAQRIVDAVRKNKVRAMVDFHNRWSPPFYSAHIDIARGDIGELYSAYFRLNDTKWVPKELIRWSEKSSVLWFLGSHSLDTLRWLFADEVRRVYSVSRKGILKSEGIDVEDMYLTTLEFANGGIAQMENGWITSENNPCINDIKCTLLGSKGQINIDTSSHNMIQKVTDDKFSIPDILVQNHIYGRPKGFAYESIRSFVDCIINEEPFPVTLKDAVITTKVILAIIESAQNRIPVDIDYGNQEVKSEMLV